MAMNDYERYGSFFGAPNINYRDGVNIARPKTIVPQVNPEGNLSWLDQMDSFLYPNELENLKRIQAEKDYGLFSNQGPSVVARNIRKAEAAARRAGLNAKEAEVPQVSSDRGVFNPYDLYRNPAGYTPGVPEVPPSTFTPKGKRVGVGSGKAASRAKIADEDFSVFDDIREGRTTFNKAFPTKRAPLSPVIPLPV